MTDRGLDAPLPVLVAPPSLEVQVALYDVILAPPSSPGAVKDTALPAPETQVLEVPVIIGAPGGE